MKITAHTLVKNEARFLWFSVMSVIDYVDEILLWDTGSTDGTVELIKLIAKENRKVKVKFLNSVGINEFAEVRQQMLSETKSDWFLMVDGDEIWWEESIQKVVQVISSSSGNDLESVVVPTINLVGDIYHYQEEAAGNYNLVGRKGHLNLRAINRKISGLHSANPHGTWGWVDESNIMIQDRDKSRIRFVDAPYLHATYLQRAGEKVKDGLVPKRSQKLKHEIGVSFPKDYFYPEVFFKPMPDIVSSPWEKMSRSFKRKAYWQTPLRKIKRRLLPKKVGY